MKKLLLLLLIPCLLLCSCNIADGDDTTTTTIDETTTDENIESPKQYMNTIEEYETLLQYKYLPDDFVTAEDISEFGKFESLSLGWGIATNAEDWWFDAYEYGVRPTDGILYLMMFHGYAVDNHPLYVPEEERTPENSRALPPKTDSDMRFYAGKGQFSSEYRGYVWIGDVQYYYADGYLLNIMWQVGDIVFWLQGGGSEGSYALYDVEPDTASPMIRDLLNAETAEAAIERFAAKLRGKTNADGE